MCKTAARANDVSRIRASVEHAENRWYAGRDLVVIVGPYHTLRVIANPPEIIPSPTRAAAAANESQFLWAFEAARSDLCSNSVATLSHLAKLSVSPLVCRRMADATSLKPLSVNLEPL